jgi:predicted CXXCH cytochrome family protein
MTVRGAAPADTSVCATCHPKQTARFLASAMGRSTGSPDAIPPGRAAHAASGSSLASEYRKGKLFHVLSERGLRAEYPVALQIGRGVKARTYAVQVGDYLLESPLSWYKTAGWDVSPGYESMQVLDFDRPVTENCLFCHAGQPKAIDSDGRRVPASRISAITCDRCHGPVDEHLRNPSAKNIVNPAKLAGAARDSVCEQCHLEGETRITNPGKSQWDYHPGDSLENTIVTYLLKEPNADGKRAVTQVEELAASKCVRASGGRLWCATCHNPHGETSNRPAQITRVCTSCHPTLSKTGHPSKTTECTSCHMSARPAGNVSHLAITDHRLRRLSVPAETRLAGPATLVAWREPPLQFRKRDLALAGLQFAAEQHLPDIAARSVKLLEAIPESQQNSDSDVLSSLEVLFLGGITPEKAVALGRWAVESTPQSATFAMNYGLALMRAGNLVEAERQLLRARELDPSLMQAAAQLAVLYDRQGRRADSKATIARFLNWNPQNIQFRLGRQP